MQNATDTLPHTFLTPKMIRRAVIEKLQPYVRYIEGWQLRLAYLRAQVNSQYASADEVELAAQRLAELREEIEANRQKFAAEAELLPPHDRIEDVRRSMERLISQLALRS